MGDDLYLFFPCDVYIFDGSNTALFVYILFCSLYNNYQGIYMYISKSSQVVEFYYTKRFYRLYSANFNATNNKLIETYMYYHIIKLSYIFFHFGELNLFLSAVTNIICINWKKKTSSILCLYKVFKCCTSWIHIIVERVFDYQNQYKYVQT